MFKHLAVGLDGSGNAAAAEELAISLARTLGARLLGAHVLDVTFLEGAFITDVSGSMGFEPFLNLQAQVRTTLEELGTTIGARFSEHAQSAGVEATFQLERAGVVAGLLDACKLADLLVVGRRGLNARLHDDFLGPTTSALLRRSPIPVLVVPDRAAAPSRPAVAYDGSPKAVRALQHAAEMCRALALPLAVITVSTTPEKARACLDEAASYLAPYELTVQYRHEAGDEVETILMKCLEDAHADLLFLGAHGHTRVVELVLGSTTEYLARRSPVPVLCVTRP